MALRIVSVLLLLLTVSCAGKDDTKSISAIDAKATYEKGLALLNDGLCALDKYTVGISNSATRVPDDEPDFKPKPSAQEGFRLITEAHKMGYHDASFIYAKAMEVGILIDEDYPASIDLYRKMAEAGHVPSQYELGQELMYGRLTKDRFLLKRTGTSVQTDVEAFAWFLKAAESGHPFAQNSVAVCLQRGSGTERDPKASFKWAKLSAFAGFVGGQETVGIHYINGDGVPQDLDMANAWFKIAADSPNNSMAKIYAGKIAEYVNQKRSAALEKQLREELKTTTKLRK
jgi:TPR repeat protein